MSLTSKQLHAAANAAENWDTDYSCSRYWFAAKEGGNPHCRNTSIP